MAQLFISNDNIITLQDITELYKIHNNINNYYHFVYKTDELSNNFGNFSLSILNEKCHHTILKNVKCHLYNNNLILTVNKYRHTIAYNSIPKNYRFDIITSIIDGKSLIIYENKI